MSIWSSIGNAITSVAGGSSHSWGDIIGAGLQVGGSLMQASASNQASNVQFQNDRLAAQSQLIQSAAQMRAAAATAKEGEYKQIEYYRQATEAYDNANRATVNAAVKSALLRRAGKETAENALAGYAGSGVVSGTGSAAYVPAYIVGRAEEDAFSAFQEGKDTADQYTRQAEAYIKAGGQAREASDTAAAGIREQADAMANLANQMAGVASQNKSANNTNTIANLLGSAGSIAAKWFS